MKIKLITYILNIYFILQVYFYLLICIVMYNIKKLFLTIVLLLFSVNFTIANEDRFSISEVSVISEDTLIVYFTKNLDRETAEFSEFMLLDDETKSEIRIKDVALEDLNSLRLTTEKDLYN